MTDGSQTWIDDQLIGMALQVTSGAYSGYTYPITDNTITTVTVSGTLPSLSSQTYAIRPYNEIHYLSCCGLVDEDRDGRGKKTYYEHDDAGHVTEVRNDVTGSGSTYPLVNYTYNDLGRQTEVKTRVEDASACRTTTYTYDQLGRVTKIVYPDNGGTRLLWDEYYQYGVNNNLVAKLVGTVSSGSITAGSVTAYEYDSLNRLTKVKYNYSASTWPIGSISISSENVSYTYSGGSGLKTEMVDDSGTSSYTYDTQGRLSTYTPPLPANYRVDYSYNTAGEKESVVIEYDDSGWTNQYRTAYAYFKNGWLKQVKGQKWNTGTSSWDDMTQVDYEYDEARNCTKRKNNTMNDVETTCVANARGEAKSITHNKTSDLYKLAYTRDGLGNPLQIAFTGSQFDEPYTNADTVRYSYDDTSRLTDQDWGYGDWTSVNSTSWSYDWVGNRGTGTDYNQVDEYLKDNGYKYDYLGNMEYDPDNTSTPRTRYYYNSDNLLSQVDDVTGGGTTSTTMTWDADQQRLKLARGSDTWEMIYDPNTSVPAVLLAKNYISSSTTYMYNVREPDGELLCGFDASETPNRYYYHFDGLGSTVLVTNGSGTVSDSFTYGAWGDVLNSPANNRKPYQFVGQLGYYAHPSTQGAALSDLLQLGVRSYDPAVGRFTQIDLLPVPGNNDYSYAWNEPTLFVDPTGLWKTPGKGGGGPGPCMRCFAPQPPSKGVQFTKCLANALGAGLAWRAGGCAVLCGVGSALFAETTFIPCFTACMAGAVGIGAVGGYAQTVTKCYNQVYKPCPGK
jgi:RHS repeat-associated protein